jgi:para-nitrobenzyl esterase
VSQPIVSTADGIVQGSATGDVRRFLGVPYAAAPVGVNRFAPPQPVVPWSGVRDATVAGPNAPQRTKAFPGLDTVPLMTTGLACR